MKQVGEAFFGTGMMVVVLKHVETQPRVIAVGEDMSELLCTFLQHPSRHFVWAPGFASVNPGEGFLYAGWRQGEHTEGVVTSMQESGCGLQNMRKLFCLLSRVRLLSQVCGPGLMF